MTISMKVNQAAVEIWEHHPVPGEDFQKRPKKRGKKGGKDRGREEGRDGGRKSQGHMK